MDSLMLLQWKECMQAKMVAASSSKRTSYADAPLSYETISYIDAPPSFKPISYGNASSSLEPIINTNAFTAGDECIKPALLQLDGLTVPSLP